MHTAVCCTQYDTCRFCFCTQMVDHCTQYVLHKRIYHTPDSVYTVGYIQQGLVARGGLDQSRSLISKAVDVVVPVLPPSTYSHNTCTFASKQETPFVSTGFASSLSILGKPSPQKNKIIRKKFTGGRAGGSTGFLVSLI